ncbi:hypothetical protein QJS10_CPB14g00746 [Acorus calamus]|uniref:CASP-like protein n=1 Tax=Acorus calamus TaxID=4465 RepID=A0AAV9DBQ0_ACOCL|nr:hypothetical protein QJS10_CPB14g00746 [Acorus calamus]
MEGLQLPVKAPPPPPPPPPGAVKIHKTLNRIVKMCNLFSFTAAIACLFSTPLKVCAAVENSIVIFNLLSYTSFVVALSLADGSGTPFNNTAIRRAEIIVSEIGTVSGLVFWTIAMLSTAARVLIERGLLSCDNSLITYAAEPPILIVTLLPALLIYLFVVIRAHTR